VTAVRETSDKLNDALDAQAAGELRPGEARPRQERVPLDRRSHEFRTALTGIQGFSELIRDGGLEQDEVKAYGGYIFNDATGSTA
jgi:signal transduction histidine kinase